MNNINFFLFSLIIITFISTKVYAVTYKRNAIESLVKEKINQNIITSKNQKTTLDVSKIDPRINIKPCDTPLTINIPEKFTSRNVNVKVSCNSPTAWQIYLTAKINTYLPVVIAKYSINKGNLLDSGNVELTYQNNYKIRGEFIENPEEVYGSKAKRKITKGHKISRKNMCIICKGESVAIVATSNNLTINTSGLALEDGNKGDHIKVKNKQSGKVITAEVKTINKVLINL